MDQLKQKRLYLRVFAISILSLVVIVFVTIAFFTTQGLHKGINRSTKDARLELTQGEIYNSGIYLNGNWEYFGDKFCSSADEVKQLGETSQYVSFPVGTIKQAEKNATYRFYFKVPDKDLSKLHLFIPTFDGEVKVFLNGMEQAKAWPHQIWVPFSSMENYYSLKADPGSEWQELVISGEFGEQTSTLYKKPVIIGTDQTIIALATTDASNEMFLVGALLLVMVNGYVFMLFRPSHILISMITLFDTVIMVRVFCSMNYTLSFIKNIFPDLIIADRHAVSASLFFLMLGGAIGCILSGILFDPNRQVPKWVTVPIVSVYLVFAVIFPYNIGFFEEFGGNLLIAVYIITFMVVFWQFTICWRKKKSGYYIFQFMKTGYIGLVVFYDITHFTKFTDFIALFYLYAIFFIMHVVVRLYDNNQTYIDVEILNVNLESTVEERTKELSEANKRLAELSIRDPLTGAYNRLYFEGALEKAMSESLSADTAIHLSMFDLDFFKRINDTYGHTAGDEQLKQVAGVVSGIVGEEAVFARIGGEEFVLLFTKTETSRVLDLIRRIRESMEYIASNNEERTTASFGVTKLKDGETAKTLVKNADVLLYQAKNTGRNCIVTDLEN